LVGLLCVTAVRDRPKHVVGWDICIYTNTLYITIMVVFFTAFSIRFSLLSSEIHNRDDTAKEVIFIAVFHGNNRYANGPQQHVIRTLHVLFYMQIIMIIAWYPTVL